MSWLTSSGSSQTRHRNADYADNLPICLCVFCTDGVCTLGLPSQSRWFPLRRLVTRRCPSFQEQCNHCAIRRSPIVKAESNAPGGSWQDGTLPQRHTQGRRWVPLCSEECSSRKVPHRGSYPRPGVRFRATTRGSWGKPTSCTAFVLFSFVCYQDSAAARISVTMHRNTGDIFVGIGGHPNYPGSIFPPPRWHNPNIKYSIHKERWILDVPCGELLQAGRGSDIKPCSIKKLAAAYNG